MKLLFVNCHHNSKIIGNARKANCLLTLTPNTLQIFFLSKAEGVGELSPEKLPGLLELKYHTISDAKAVLGGIAKTKELFVGFQEYLYAPVVA